MTPSDRYARCKAIAEGTESQPDAELARFPEYVAREYVRAETRRNPAPQLPLPGVA